MNKIYIDFDGVLLDTWEYILKKYYDIYNTKEIIDSNLRKLMIDIGWDKIIKNSNEINDNIKKLKLLSKKYYICVLSKINSSIEEQIKRKFLLNNGIVNMCFVPYDHPKSRYAVSKENILIDDDIKNLDDWSEHGGKSIFFNKNLNNVDSYGNLNDNYLIINDLLNIHDIIKDRRNRE